MIDILASAAGIVLLAPVLASTAVLVRREFGRPVVFLQERPGLEGRVFRIRKFRSMTNDTDAVGRLLPPEQRLTLFGRLLRSTSLDELPELINVLIGDMSLVGPRPLRVEYTPHYSAEQARRLLVRPGISGPAQVAGRNLLKWEDRFAQDVEYVDGASFSTDMRVLLATLRGVVRRHGVEPPGFGGCGPVCGDAAGVVMRVILGAGSYGETILELAADCGESIDYFVDDDTRLHGSEPSKGSPLSAVPSRSGWGWKVLLRPSQSATGPPGSGSPSGSEAIRLGPWTLVHPGSYVSPSASLGDGCLIHRDALVWTRAQLSNHVILSPGARVAHHTTLGEYSMISMGAEVGSAIEIGHGAFVGMGATVMTGVKRLGNRSVVGAGSVVIHDVPDGVTVVGMSLSGRTGHNPGSRRGPNSWLRRPIDQVSEWCSSPSGWANDKHLGSPAEL